jgi:hypothetical protein
VAATGVAADVASADMVTVNTNINANSSLEVFVDIQGFTAGASTFSVVTTADGFSQANPLAPYSELMLRGAGALAQLRMQQLGAGGAVTNNTTATANSVFNAVNVGAAFAFPNFTNGTFFDGGPNNTNSPAPIIYRTDLNVGQFANGGVYHFRFFNNSPGGDGRLYDAWATIDFAPGSPTITDLHVNTSIPEPSGMALLCMGAAGLAAYRRRRNDN